LPFNLRQAHETKIQKNLGLAKYLLTHWQMYDIIFWQLLAGTGGKPV
jgi:hypothetical protein